MISRDPQNVRIAGRDVPVVTANTVVVGHRVGRVLRRGQALGARS